MMAAKYRLGEKVVFKSTRYSVCPSPRAKNIIAAPNGEAYEYEVDKYWIVIEADQPDSVLLQTRTGTTHRLASDDVRLRKATWWERIIHHHWFPQPLAKSMPLTSADHSA